MSSQRRCCFAPVVAWSAGWHIRGMDSDFESSAHGMSRLLRPLDSVIAAIHRPEVLAALHALVISKPSKRAAQEQGFVCWQMGAAFFWALTPTAIYSLAKALAPQELGPVEFNLEALQGKDEFKKAIGAVVLREPHAVCEGWIAILAHPAGNRFQIVTPMGKEARLG